MTTIYLIRHAEAEGNLYRRIHGWYDSLITDNGWLQIAALEQRFSDIHVDAVYSSDLYRTMSTARAVYVPKGLPLRTDPDLRELNMGDWEDDTWAGARHAHGAELARFNRCDTSWRAPNGESLIEAGQRMEAALRRIARRHPDQTVAVFSHGTIIRQTLAMLKKIPPESWKDLGHSDNTAVTCLSFQDDQFQVLYESDNSHLDPSISTLAGQTWWRKGARPSHDVDLWFRPIDWPAEEPMYLEARREFWLTIHGPDIPFDGEGFLQAARKDLSHSPWGISVAMSEDKMVGLLQVDTERYRQDNAGYIPFCYMIPEERELNLGIQLIGQAVSFFRPLGRDKLRLRCAPYNDRAQHFYAKYGFVKIGEEQGSRVPLDILEKYIGYDR